MRTSCPPNKRSSKLSVSRFTDREERCAPDAFFRIAGVCVYRRDLSLSRGGLTGRLAPYAAPVSNGPPGDSSAVGRQLLGGPQQPTGGDIFTQANAPRRHRAALCTCTPGTKQSGVALFVRSQWTLRTVPSMSRGHRDYFRERFGSEGWKAGGSEAVEYKAVAVLLFLAVFVVDGDVRRRVWDWFTDTHLR